MKPKQIVRVVVDVAMTALFLVLMAYHVTGNSLHEWLGMGLFLLFVVHHVLNLKWFSGLFKGRYTAVRVFMVVVNLLLLASMAGMMVSGILLSRDVLGFLNLRAGMFGRRLHMVSSAWGFCLMAVHLGLHWGMVLDMAGRIPVRGKWVGAGLRCMGMLLSLYGIYAFVSRHIGEYMFLLMEYAFFDYGEPAVFFFMDYICVLILFAALSYYLARLLRRRKAGKGAAGRSENAGRVQKNRPGEERSMDL